MFFSIAAKPCSNIFLDILIYSATVQNNYNTATSKTILKWFIY